MTDRQPGAPGQYILTIDPSVAQKLLIGEPVTVTLTRDDQPVVEGTPYNKASVLPDDLAGKICPNVVDPTPADAFRGLLGQTSQIVLSAVGWVNNQQRAAAAGVTAINRVDVAADPASDENYYEYTGCGVRVIAQAEGYLTFACDSVPGRDLLVNIAAKAGG